MNKNYKRRIETYFHIKPKSLNSRLIDPVTGDLLEYDSKSGKWRATLNVGIHNKYMQESIEFGKHVMPRPRFIINSVKKEYEITIGTSNESIVHLDKKLNQKPLFKGVEPSFLVSHSKGWVIHPITFVNPAKRFEILASSDISPQIINLENTIACLFPVSRKYPNSVKIMHNYLQIILKKVKFENLHKNSVMVYNY